MIPLWAWSPAGSKTGGQINVKSIEQLTTDLEGAKDELNKAISLCERISDSSQKIENMPERLADSLVLLAETQEKAEDAKSEAVYALNFKKDKITKKLLDQGGYYTLIKATKDVKDNLQSDCRVCRAHVPKLRA